MSDEQLLDAALPDVPEDLEAAVPDGSVLSQELLDQLGMAQLRTLGQTGDTSSFMPFSDEQGRRMKAVPQSEEDAALLVRLKKYGEKVRGRLLDLEQALPEYAKMAENSPPSMPDDFDEMLLQLIDKV
jgi:hypothetical protein